MAKWPFIPWRQSTASKFRPDSLNYGCLSVSKSGEVSAGDSNNKAVPVLPTGSVIPFAGKTAPTGWLMCQGQAVSRTTYAQLFSVIGTTFGSGDGSTTFNLPDLRGRVAVGVDSDANSLGTKDGQKSTTLTVEQIPSHNHFSGNPALLYTDYAAAITQTPTASGVNNTKGPTRSNSVGGGQAHSNVQPSLYLNQIIKI